MKIRPSYTVPHFCLDRPWSDCFMMQKYNFFAKNLSSELATARCQYGLSAPPISYTALAGFRIADL